MEKIVEGGRKRRTCYKKIVEFQTGKVFGEIALTSM